MYLEKFRVLAGFGIVEGAQDYIFLLEPILLLLVGGFCFWISRKHGALFAHWNWASLTHGKALGILVGFFLLLASYSAWMRPPVPEVHDEHSYLLAAETFSEGRWTNPTHPMWQHFETYHVLQQPSYQSKYLPLHPAILAVGKLLTGYYIAGAWIEGLAALIGTYWVLAGVVPIGFALLGTLFLATRILFTWMVSGYMGGGIAILGGALVVGSLLRLVQRAKASQPIPLALGWILGTGVALLMHSRPYESLFFLVPLLVWGVWVALSQKRALDVVRIAGAALLVWGSSLAALLYYNWQVTGSALVFPYSVHDTQYMDFPVVLWGQGSSQVHLRHPVMKDTYEYLRYRLLMPDWQKENLFNLGFAFVGKMLLLWKVLVGFSLTLLAVIGWTAWTAKRPEVRSLVLWGGISFLVGLGTITYCLPFYAASGMVFLSLAVTLGAWAWMQARPQQRWLFAAMVITALLAPGAAFTYGRFAIKPYGDDVREYSSVRAQIEKAPGRQLVLLRYPPGAFVNEWVFNAADIDRSKIVWARSIDDARDERLMQYFSDRRPWLLEFENRGKDDLAAKLSTRE